MFYFAQFNLSDSGLPGEGDGTPVSSISAQIDGDGLTGVNDAGVAQGPLGLIAAWDGYSISSSHQDAPGNADVAADTGPFGGYPSLAAFAADDAGAAADEPALQRVVDIGEEMFVVLADPENSSLSVFTLLDGQPDTLTDQVIDTLQTRFSGVTTIEQAQLDGQGLIAAAGVDDGFSLFSLHPGGRLHHVETVEGSWTAPLNGITAIDLDVTGATLSITVSREHTAQDTRLELDLPANLLPGVDTGAPDESATPSASVEALYTLDGGDLPASGDAGTVGDDSDALDWLGTAMNWVPGPDGQGMVLELTSHEQDFQFQDSATATDQSGVDPMMPDASVPLQYVDTQEGQGSVLHDLFDDTEDGASWVLEAQMFQQGQDMVRIVGFKVDGESDAIDLSRLGGFEQPGDVLAAATEVADGVLIATGYESAILIEGIELRELTESDFII